VHCLEKTRPDVVLLDLERTEILAPLSENMRAKGVGEVSRHEIKRLVMQYDLTSSRSYVGTSGGFSAPPQSAMP
jgi:hypothetical protein